MNVRLRFRSVLLWRFGLRRTRLHAWQLVGSAPVPYLYAMSEAPEIQLTSSAAARVAAIAQRQGKAPILRLAVDGGGCAGFQYRFGLADSIESDDTQAVQDGVTLVVDEVSLDLVRGSAVDYVESLGGASFQVTNPNAASGCGCGTSFSI
jgi:iron-sulfur cluster assembly accessory protein